MKVEEKVVLLIALITLLVTILIAGPKAFENLKVILQGYEEKTTTWDNLKETP